MVVEEKKQIDLKGLKIKTDQQIKYLNEKTTLTEEEVYIVTKDFFSVILDIDYQFSHEELLEELNKTYLDTQIKEHIDTFVRNIGRIEYNSHISFSSDELKKQLQELQEIVDKLILEETKQNSKGFSLFSHSQTKSIGELIESIKIESHLDKAKEMYADALKQYNEMNEKDQAFYYERLQEAFKHLKSSSQ